MRRSGPGGLRLQEVAERAGVSHPTILHHFESREGLMRALNQRALEALGEVLRERMESPDAGRGDSVAAAFAAYRNGLAERIIWMMQSMENPGDPPAGLALFDDMTDRLHALRVRFSPPERTPDRADSAAIIHLVTIAAFGDAIIGRRLRRCESDGEAAAAQDRFETWLSTLIAGHVQNLAQSQITTCLD